MIARISDTLWFWRCGIGLLDAWRAAGLALRYRQRQGRDHARGWPL